MALGFLLGRGNPFPFLFLFRVPFWGSSKGDRVPFRVLRVSVRVLGVPCQGCILGLRVPFQGCMLGFL